jgi:hypothetical protein
MPGHTLIAMFIIASCALSTGASAQKVYKCGNVYSQTPCFGGGLIDPADPRTSAQKDQADLAIGRDARLADAMEKARLAQEKKDLAANTPAKKSLEKPASAKTPKKVSVQQAKAKKKKEKEFDYFVAQLPGDKKKKSTPKKSSPEKDVNKI